MTVSLDTRYYLIENDGSVTFTAEGKEHYLPYFDKLGIDITSIHTLKRLTIAVRLARMIKLEEMENALSERPPNIESRWLLAQIRGDADECQRLKAILRRKQEQGLRVIQ